MPRPVPVPSVVRLTTPDPFADTALPTVIVSVRPAPVSITNAWLAAPFVTTARFTPPGPIVIASALAPPTTDRPPNCVIFVRSTVIVSDTEFTLIPGTLVDSVPAPLAVIVKRLDPELYDVLRFVSVVPPASSDSTTRLLASVTSTASIARDSSASNPRSV
jgi:hypothetical protein